MSNHIRYSIIVLTLLASIFNGYCQTNYYVSTNGNDANPGTIKKPFRTLEAARNAFRKNKIKHPETTTKKIAVYIRQGLYHFNKTFELESMDSGTVNGEVIFKAYKNESVRITGGVYFSAEQLKKVTDRKVLDRIISTYVRDNIYYFDLKAAGIDDYGKLKSRGFGRAVLPSAMELFFDDKPMKLAQYPNPDYSYIKITEVTDTGSVPRRGDTTDFGGSFRCKDNRVKLWSKAHDAWVQGMFGTVWADDFLKVKSIDTSVNEISLVQAHLYGISGGHFKAINLLEEIDMPGEYFIDRDKGILYFYPPSHLNGKTFALSVMEEPLVAIENSSNVHFENIVFECARGMAVYMESGRNNLLAGCTFRNLGSLAVSIGKGVRSFSKTEFLRKSEPMSRVVGNLREHLYADATFNRNGGINNGLLSCDIYNTGAGGISLGGGDRVELEPAGNFVDNCHIHHVNRLELTYRPCVDVSGVGNRVTHCEMNNSTHSAILFMGNDHLFEYNIFHHTLQASNDAGVIYGGRDLTAYGTVIRYNFFHDNIPDTTFFPKPWSQGIYIDDGMPGITVESNIFANMKTSILASGWDTKILNNLAVNCGSVIVFQFRYRFDVMYQRCKALNVTEPPYSVKYPTLPLHLQLHDSAGFCHGSEIINNVIVGNVKKCVIIDTKPKDVIIQKDNIILPGDAAFINSEKMDFRLRPESEIFKLVPGFKQIPQEKMGLFSDEFRAKIH